MASGTFYPAANGDDGYWRGGVFDGPGVEEVTFGDISGTGVNQFFRFVSVTIPQGSIITTAYIKVTAKDTRTSPTIKSTIYANDVDNAVAPTSLGEANALVKTSASVNWTLPAFYEGTQYDTPSIVTVLQEVVNRGSFASGNAVQFIFNDNGTTYNERRAVSGYKYVSGNEKAELHVEWAEAINVEATTANLTIATNRANIPYNIDASSASLTISANAAEVVPGTLVAADAAVLTITTHDADVNHPINILATSSALTITANSSDIFVGVIVNGTAASLSVSANAADVSIAPNLPVIETAILYEALGWGWIKSLTSTAEIADTVTVNMAVPVTDVLTAGDAVVTKWVGTETATSTLEMFGNALVAQVFNESVTSTSDAVDAVTFLHTMISVAESTFGAADATSSKATFNPLVTESVAAAATISLLLTINKTIAESAAATETVIPGWLETVSDSAAIVDTAAIRWVAMHILTDSLEATDAATGLFNFTDTIADTFEAAAAAVIKQALQDSITEILNFNMTLMLDDELWECWVLNTNEFAPSVYSGFDFNSYAVYNDQAFGCREDGIYRLDGTTDNNSAFNAGIVLPETSFGTARKKRFRKAYFGLSGSSPSIRMETSSGNVTYNITSSKANIGRNQYGKEWTVKVQGFDDMDFIELVPIILTR